MKNLKHFRIYDYMVDELKLKGSQLLIYAYINTALYLQDGLPQTFTYDELANELPISRTSIKRNMELLIEEGLINEKLTREGGEIVSSYTTNRHRPCSFKTHNPYRNYPNEETLKEVW